MTTPRHTRTWPLRRIAATLAVVAACASAPSLSALTFSLDRQRVPTTIEGVPVELFVSGPVDVTLADGNAKVTIDATVDLRDVQRHFAAIARASAVSARCGNSLSLDRATLLPVQVGGRSLAEVAGDATFRQITCGSDGAPVGMPRVTRGALAVRISAHVEQEQRLGLDLTVADATAPPIAQLMEQAVLRGMLVKMLTGTLSVAAGTSSVTAPLSKDATRYEPRVQSAAFASVDGALAARLNVTLSVPVAELFRWNVGK